MTQPDKRLDDTMEGPMTPAVAHVTERMWGRTRKVTGQVIELLEKAQKASSPEEARGLIQAAMRELLQHVDEATELQQVLGDLADNDVK